MSRKNADSKLPEELNENWGSNYMMDGFWHDMEYGHGLRDSIGKDPVPQPSASGFAHLPDGVLVSNEDLSDLEVPEGVVLEEEGAMDLGGLEIVAAVDPALDRGNTGVVDHSWLADAFQDPDRLPENPVNNVIPDLQDAWGDRTDGIHRIDLYDREVTDHEAVTQRKEDDDPFQADKLAHVVRSAMRRSALGHPIRVILDDAAAQAGTRLRGIARAMKAVEAEHGLVGNVYVRASAYPGLHRGRWSRELGKVARGARYLVAQAGLDCAGCAEALGLRLVDGPADIDWNDAYAHYAPMLAATGRLDRSATIIDKRDTLRRAFLVDGRAPALHVETSKVQPPSPADAVTVGEARESLAAQAAQAREFVSTEKRDRRAESMRLVRKLGALVKARLISLAEAEALAKSRAPAIARMRMAEKLASRSARGEYRGGIVRDPRVSISAETFAADTETAKKHEAHAKTASADEERERSLMLGRFLEIEQLHRDAETKIARIEDAVRSGRRGRGVADLVAETFTAAERMLVAARLDHVLVQAGCYDVPVSSREYSGPRLRQADSQRGPDTVSPVEVRAAVRWARRQMNEGAVGDELDQLLSHRFSVPVLKAANDRLVQIRGRHEGLAGHLYVDAAAYASAAGTTGCDEGALRHRANGVRHLLAMERCSSCVFRNADDVCQKYHKMIVSAPPVEDPEAYRREILASHARTDVEDTAALFSDSSRAMSDPVSDFGLHNASLDDVEIDGAPPPSTLEGIFFGGFEL